MQYIAMTHKKKQFNNNHSKSNSSSKNSEIMW